MTRLRFLKWLLLPAVLIAGLATIAPQRCEAQVYYYSYPSYYSYRPFYRPYYRYPYYGYYAPPVVTSPGPIFTVPPAVQAYRVPMYIPTPQYIAPNYQVWEY